LGFFLEDLPGAVGRTVVDYDDFVRDAAEVQLEMQVLDGGRDTAFLVTRGDDYRQESEWRCRRRRQLAVFSVQFSVGGSACGACGEGGNDECGMQSEEFTEGEWKS
jgi:hypothetical protein